MSSDETPLEQSQAPSLEIAHVLFMDIVAYTRFPIDHQRRLIKRLQVSYPALPPLSEQKLKTNLFRCTPVMVWLLFSSMTPKPHHTVQLKSAAYYELIRMKYLCAWVCTRAQCTAWLTSTRITRWPEAHKYRAAGDGLWRCGSYSGVKGAG